MNIILIGTGRMGRLLKECALDAGDAVVGEYGRANIAELAAAPAADVAIDFSGPEALPAVAAYVARTGTPLVSGTTGYTAGEKAAVAALGEHAPVVWSANYSLGVAVLARALRLVTAALRPDFDIEVTETHHNRKKDAPSGTAKLLVEALDPAGELTPVYGREGLCGERRPDEIGIHALRGGTVAGTHSVHFFGPDEELEFTHRATSRRIFVLGGRAIVGNRCHIGAGTVLAGVVEPASATPVVIEDDVMIGANAVVIEGVRVGRGAVVGAGAIVIKDVPAGAVVVGNPARIIKMKDEKTEAKTALIDALRTLD